MSPPAGRRSKGEETASADDDGRDAPALGLAAAEEGATLARVAEIAAGCRACELWERGTQTVFGQGPTPAALMIVGEQPGDREDVAGEPFVGPAGQLLDRALRTAGIERQAVFVTNVVKHFKWRPSGKRRLHEKPARAEVSACHPWIEAELALVQPRVLVCLGATAATALLGPDTRVSRTALTAIPTGLAPFAVATLHPSAILRAEDGPAREVAFERLVADLRFAAQHIEAAGSTD